MKDEKRPVAILRAAVEAGAVPQRALVIALVADADGDTDMAFVAPAMLPPRLIKMVLAAAMKIVDERGCSLRDRIEVARGT